MDLNTQCLKQLLMLNEEINYRSVREIEALSGYLTFIDSHLIIDH